MGMKQNVGSWWHLGVVDLGCHSRECVDSIFNAVELPSRDVQTCASLTHVAVNHPSDRCQMAVKRIASVPRMAITALCFQGRATRSGTSVPSRIGVSVWAPERGFPKGWTVDRATLAPNKHPKISATFLRVVTIAHSPSTGVPDSEESTTARSCFCAMKFAWVIPRRSRSFSAGTLRGPGEGALPGAGCGNAVDMAV